MKKVPLVLGGVTVLAALVILCKTICRAPDYGRSECRKMLRRSVAGEEPG